MLAGHPSLAVDMLSDFSTLSFDIPILPAPDTPPPEQDPLASLNFDDLLDIAREFEFTRTITHIWPCEEEPDACHEMGLDELLAAIVPTLSTAAESPLPLPSSAPPTTIAPFQEPDSTGSTPRQPATGTTAIIPRKPEFALTDADRAQVQTAMPALVTSESTLFGWSPPNGSQFVDLDDNLMAPRSPADMWNPPWLAMFLAPSRQPPGDASQLSMPVPAIGDSQPQMMTTKFSPVETINKAADDPKENGVPTMVHPSPRPILEPVRRRSTICTNLGVGSHTTTTPQAKPPKSRLQSTSGANGSSTAHYGRAPRGGIPPHIARSVTQANILRVQKERKVMQDSLVNTTTGSATKPSVLRKVSHVERETSRRVDGSGNAKKTLCSDEKLGKERASKRARVG